MTATLFAFTLAWGELIYAMTFISSGTYKTLTAGTVAELIRGDIFYWGPLIGGRPAGLGPRGRRLTASSWTTTSAACVSGATKY